MTRQEYDSHVEWLSYNKAKHIEWAPKYCVTQDGKIYSVMNKKGLTKPERRETAYTSKGYPCINLLLPNGKRKTHLVHRLIAESFLGNIKNKVVHHRDKNINNNSVENLEILTYSEHNKKRTTMSINMNDIYKVLKKYANKSHVIKNHNLPKIGG